MTRPTTPAATATTRRDEEDPGRVEAVLARLTTALRDLVTVRRRLPARVVVCVVQHGVPRREAGVATPTGVAHRRIVQSQPQHTANKNKGHVDERASRDSRSGAAEFRFEDLDALGDFLTLQFDLLSVD